MIVISIIGILAAGMIIVINPVTYLQRARDGERKSDLHQIQAALELYRADKGSYPAASLIYCDAQLDDGGSPPSVVYMKKIPCEPDGSGDYSYSSSGYTYTLTTTLEEDGSLYEVYNP